MILKDKNGNIEIIKDADGKSLVVVNDIRFKGRQGIDWLEVAMYGWYRYDSRFALPVYTEEGNLERYNIFSVRLLVRHAQDGGMYLYDILRTKKETK